LAGSKKTFGEELEKQGEAARFCQYKRSDPQPSGMVNLKVEVKPSRKRKETVKMRNRLLSLFCVFGLFLLTSGIGLAEMSATIQSSTDYGEDTDGDALYEYLIVEISVNVKSLMIFTIEGDYTLEKI